MNVQFVYTVLVIFSAAFAEQGDPCTSPNGKSATCVPLNTCQGVFNAAFTKNSSAYDFVKKSSCQHGGGAPLVCCESPGPVIIPNYETKALPDRTVCGVMKEESRILGGKITELGEFPWMVGIEFKSKASGEGVGLKCGGSLINNQYVLTAAHCLVVKELEPLNVWLGDWKISTDPDCKELVANVECADAVQKVPVKKVIPNIFYSARTGSNDIGLILLENQIQFTDYISPICLPHPNLPSPEPGFRMTVTGWGATEDGNVSDILRKVEVPLVSNKECNEKFNKTGKLTTSQQLCAGGNGEQDSCQGDAGGPLMRTYEDKPGGRTQWYQDGVVSYGVSCGIVGYPAVYTRVASYMDWIINIISED